MADIDVRIRQRAVTELLTAEGETTIGIHKGLSKVYGEITIDASTFRRWVRRCTEAEGELPLADEKLSDCSHSTRSTRSFRMTDG